MDKLATHSPVRVQGKLRRSRICTGTVHQRRPPSRTRPTTETENMSAIALQPLSISFFFRLLFYLFSFLYRHQRGIPVISRSLPAPFCQPLGYRRPNLCRNFRLRLFRQYLFSILILSHYSLLQTADFYAFIRISRMQKYT